MLLWMCYMHYHGAVFSVISPRSWKDAFAIWATTSPSSCMTMWLALCWPNTNWSSPFCCVPTCCCKYRHTEALSVRNVSRWQVFGWAAVALVESCARLVSLSPCWLMTCVFFLKYSWGTRGLVHSSSCFTFGQKFQSLLNCWWKNWRVKFLTVFHFWHNPCPHPSW